MTFTKILSGLIFCMIFLSETKAQIAISGMVVDSVSLEPLPGTTIRLKKAKRGTMSNEKGFFTIISGSYDTLVFSRIGYQSLEYPLFSTEKDILILVREEITKLKEVVVNFYPEEKVIHAERRPVKTLTLGDAINSPFTYFSKTEKEKRMLARLRQEQQQVQVYVDLITQPQFKFEVMDKFTITEDQYYDILVMFNSEHRSAQYLTDELEISKRLHAYFEKTLNK